MCLHHSLFAKYTRIINLASQWKLPNVSLHKLSTLHWNTITFVPILRNDKSRLCIAELLNKKQIYSQNHSQTTSSSSFVTCFVDGNHNCHLARERTKVMFNAQSWGSVRITLSLTNFSFRYPLCSKDRPKALSISCLLTVTVDTNNAQWLEHLSLCIFPCNDIFPRVVTIWRLQDLDHAPWIFLRERRFPNAICNMASDALRVVLA